MRFWAKLPEGIIEGQLFGPRLQALTGYLKGSLHASYSGLQAFCRDVLNIHVARSHLCNVIKRVNEALATPCQELKEHIPTEPVTLAKRLCKYGDAIFRFLFDPAAPPTNNGGELSIRQLVIDRRITQGSRSLMGRQWNARIWTVLDTCRKQGRSAWQFLQNALSAYYFKTPAPSLLPNAQKDLNGCENLSWQREF